MGDAGQKLKQVRERLGFTYREVEEASQRIAKVRGSDEFIVALSRLADIENQGVVPSIFKLYSLCAIYRIDITEVMEWYGASVRNLPADSAVVPHPKTHRVRFRYDDGEGEIPLAIDPGLDLDKTQFLSRFVQRWGKIPLMLLNRVELKHLTYGFIGAADWSMFPLLPPGALVVIDQSRRRVLPGGWSSENERPIYFLEHRDGYACGWCSLEEGRLTVQFHPSSSRAPEFYEYPAEVEIIGQVTYAGMTMDPVERRPPND